MKSNHPSSHLQVGFITLGCAKNLVDSEKMLAVLAEAGLVLVGSDDPADAVIINTCGFIAEAREEARENIEYCLERKRAGQIGCVIAAGCLAQYRGEKLIEQFPDIDAVVGLAQRDKIAQIVRQVVGDSRKTSGKIESGSSSRAIIQTGPFDGQVLNDRARLRITEPCWAYLRISEGCDRKCTFCTIPVIRGPFRSKPPEAVIEEARELVGDGAVELNLIAQETSSYGIDLGYEPGLAGLLREMNNIEELRWLRVLYAHPATLSEAQIAAFAECEKVVPYIDLPLQHINDRILKMMNRRIDREGTEQLIEKLRRTIDNLTIRTTMLAGFPTETDQEFEELLEFVREYRFEVVGCFMYSAEEGTSAARIKGQIAQETKQQRFEQLMQAQQEIAFDHAEALIGSRLPCLITSELPEQDLGPMELDANRQWFVARHIGQAPEIDSECYLGAEPQMNTEPGIIVSAIITERREYDLVGRIDSSEYHPLG